MRRITQILEVPFDALTMEEAVEKALGFLEDGGAHYICTPNPEIVMEAQKDHELMEILRKADLVVPDGIGVVWASRYSEIVLKERVAGYDLTQNLFRAIENTEHKVYFFGGAPGVAATAARKMKKVYPGLRIAGGHNGYFDAEEEKKILADIKKAAPSILLVGLGAPKQEKWIYEHLTETGAKIAIGVGGSFDVMAGNVKRAPKLFRKLGLEWFYRLITQPTRWKRMLRLPKFALTVLKKQKRR
ncbi:WecB/TagA/CpsF family glycosyltransferase [Anaerotignum lactatifermentans]|uniref:N-acetylglucosaminyldiphosphoundecaprenol N-acetyl-beta-D-mannosaminyltransferase n=1 Tax=Anaerotignum lactatifermentans TaxID=160404 RepID=A0ABS2G6F5_9FIRM|nr:WecB/TagA/CpsF family glycosyltransferase [Anaerotignum lactatifermentans]MBM6828709.1 WecB/TagA/CpsF family glycosyltransferase [Anaerotignum lactatifermentans]MBM6877036.1 WecB/TagA/CpsF family glycosyltransferase [Anaerotignum lactatifermentans]MBM6950291.1 WecB/TagA/CpsF family glycosyltransferase [Anaerotignum lactatifermentans]